MYVYIIHSCRWRHYDDIDNAKVFDRIKIEKTRKLLYKSKMLQMSRFSWFSRETDLIFAQ